jgi:nitrate reductase cytochrome c-type subunit
MTGSNGKKRVLWATWLLVLLLVAARGIAQGETRADRAIWAPSASSRSPVARPVPSRGGPSTAVFPPRGPRTFFTHTRHLRVHRAKCLGCHAQAASSRRSADNLLPKATACDPCHHVVHGEGSAAAVEPSDSRARCGLCHPSQKGDRPGRVVELGPPTANLRFDHRAHRARNIACTQCHGWVLRADQPKRQDLPRMRDCLRCHDAPEVTRGAARGGCPVCHPTRNGRLVTAFVTGQLIPTATLGASRHGQDFLRRHAQPAGKDSALCANCHRPEDCARCHDGRVQPRSVHPGDWLSAHPVAARFENPRCASCHRKQSFCLTCHQRVGVTATGPYDRAVGQGRLHPPASVWSGLPRTRRHHGWEAQRNLSQCVSCHFERDCVVCHATSGRGGPGRGPADSSGRGANPHPPGFLRRCRTALRKNVRPCLVCHTPGDPMLGRCSE